MGSEHLCHLDPNDSSRQEGANEFGGRHAGTNAENTKDRASLGIVDMGVHAVDFGRSQLADAIDDEAAREGRSERGVDALDDQSPHDGRIDVHEDAGSEGDDK